MGAHNLCFRAKIRKNVYPVHPSFTMQKWGVRGYSFYGLVFVMRPINCDRHLGKTDRPQFHLCTEWVTHLSLILSENNG